MHKRLVLAGFGLAALVTGASGAGCNNDDPDAVTVYVGRSSVLVQPLLEQFADESGIDIHVRYGDGTDLALSILEEGDNTAVDVYYGQDVGTLGALKEAGLLAPLSDDILSRVAPAFRSPDGLWVGVSGRVRVAAYNTDTIDPGELPETVLDYVKPEWKGRVGIVPRSDGFPEFVTALRVTQGEDFARQWLKDLKANSPRIYPNNIAAIQAVANREIDVALVNHYYAYRFIAEEGEDFNARNSFFEDGDLGGLFLVSGAAVMESSNNKEGAEELVRFLLSPTAQEYLAGTDFEYPVAEGAAADAALPPLTTLTAPDVDLSDLGDLRGSLELMRETGILP